MEIEEIPVLAIMNELLQFMDIVQCYIGTDVATYIKICKIFEYLIKEGDQQEAVRRIIEKVSDEYLLAGLLM